MLTRDQIKAQQTYRRPSGSLVYVQDISGQRVTYSNVGQIDRLECSLGRFAAQVISEAPNG